MVMKEMESEILKDEVFPIILNRIKERKDSLISMNSKFRSHGLEGWFKVEIIASLANTKHAVKELHPSPDLLLESGIEIELKGATDFSIGYIKNGVKYGSPCLFLANGSNKNTIRKLERDKDVKVIRHETFSDGKNEWIIGLIKPA